MKLRIFSTVGEALNFGGRRLETIARVAWLPVVLILLLNMVTVFAYLSVIAGKTITFAEIQTFVSAQQLLGQYAARGWANNPEAMMLITTGNLVLQTILVASLMAPLIRYAGLGERPAPGVIKLAFGADQIRYILASILSYLIVALLIIAPMSAATFFILKYILAAMSETMAASFPNADSLHTIELLSASDVFKAKGVGWIFSSAVPLISVIPFALVLWGLLFMHFHPSNRNTTKEATNPFLRGLATLLFAGVLAAGGYWLFKGQIAAYFLAAASLSSDNEPVKAIFANTPVNARLWLGTFILLLTGYLNLRLFAYPGVAVARKSLGFGNLLRVSRGWNIVRLQIILFVVGLFLVAVQFVVNWLLTDRIWEVIVWLYQATATSTRLVNSGVTDDWVAPLFIWTWNLLKIAVTILLTFFSFGVAAGLYGRLYRDSERDDR